MVLDERYFTHRYKATSHAAVVGALVAGGWFIYEILANDQIRWDLASILAAMALTKLAAMIYFRWKD